MSIRPVDERAPLLLNREGAQLRNPSHNLHMLFEAIDRPEAQPTHKRSWSAVAPKDDSTPLLPSKQAKKSSEDTKITQESAKHLRNTPEKQCYIDQALEHFPLNEQESISALATPLMNEIEDGIKCYYALLGLKNIPENQRADVLEKALSLIKEIEGPQKCFFIIGTIGKIPENLRKQIIELAFDQLKQAKSAKTCKSIIQKIIKHLQVEKAHEEAQATVLVTLQARKDTKAEPEKNKLINKARIEIPELNREHIFSIASPLIKELNCGLKCYNILLCLEEIPKEQRKDALDKAAPFIKEIKDPQKCSYILYTLGQVPENLRGAVVQQITPYDLMNKNANECCSIIEKASQDLQTH
jgi:hypothetical protein